MIKFVKFVITIHIFNLILNPINASVHLVGWRMERK